MTISLNPRKTLQTLLETLQRDLRDQFRGMEMAWDNMKDEIEDESFFDELEAVITEAKEGVSKALLHSEEFLKHTDQIFIEMFQNHDFKEWISLKIMLFWLYKVIMPIIHNFYVCQIIKVTLGFDLKKKNFHQVAPLSKKQLKYFSNTNNSTTLTPSGPPGVSREAKLSTEFEFGSLVR